LEWDIKNCGKIFGIPMSVMVLELLFVSLDLVGILKLLLDLFCDAINIGIRNVMKWI